MKVEVGQGGVYRVDGALTVKRRRERMPNISGGLTNSTHSEVQHMP